MVETWMHRQIEMSERLYEMMVRDHKERVGCMAAICDTSASLMRKLKERDEEISRLRAELQAYKTAEKL
jgi:hypothetical protein